MGPVFDPLLEPVAGGSTGTLDGPFSARNTPSWSLATRDESPAAPWEVALAIALTATAAYLLILLGGRLYGGALLRGGKVKWREAWKVSP